MKLRLQPIAIACVGVLTAGALFCGFTLADQNMRMAAFPENAAILSLQADAAPLQYQVSVFGQVYHVSLGWLNEAARIGQRVSCFIPPSIRLGGQLVTWGLLSRG